MNRPQADISLQGNRRFLVGQAANLPVTSRQAGSLPHSGFAAAPKVLPWFAA
jgi:hypothetical protein